MAKAPVVMVAVSSFIATVDGEEHIVREGERLAGDHPLVRAHPDAFTPEASANLRT